MTASLRWGVALILATTHALPPLLVAQSPDRVDALGRVSGVVFVDRNYNAVRDPGEEGLPGVAVSNQSVVVATGGDGRFSISAGGYGIVFVVQPSGYVVRGARWRRADAGSEIAFPLEPATGRSDFTFIHASDTHLDARSLGRFRQFRAVVDSLAPAFVVITGDLVRDALRVPDSVAVPQYEMLTRELAAFRVPVYTVPGNHENFGIERHSSLVSPDHPLYGKRMYRSFLGPNYYSFTYGDVHFVGLDTVDYDDLWYHGHVDSLQLAWLARDLAQLPINTPVVTFNHIPLASSGVALSGYDEESVAPTLIRIGRKTQLRHSVYNATDVIAVLGDRLEIALGGHFHRQERVSFTTSRGLKRFYQAPAVVGSTPGEGPLEMLAGVILYRVTEGRVDEGTFVPLSPPS